MLFRSGGIGKWLYYLKGYDLGDFSEHTKPLMTEAKDQLIELGLKPAQRFMADWLMGRISLPVRTCSGSQLYRAFRRWCDMEGERFPPNKAGFTRDAERSVAERDERDSEGKRLPARLTYKVVGVDQGAGERQSVRCWLPRGTGPTADSGLTLGRWVAECLQEFDRPLEAFCRPLRGSTEVDA